MLFSSVEFLAFFAIVYTLFLLLPKLGWLEGRRWLLLLASYYFYMSWNPPFVALLWLSTVVDYHLARRLMTEDSPKTRKTLVIVSMLVNLGLLCYFKYAAFLADNLALFGVDHSFAVEGIILPLGISFYTFQTMSYTIDVYRGKMPASESFLDFALYVTFFPQLIAGPIVRATEFLPQLVTLPDPKAEDRIQGWRLVMIGYFKKVYLADYLALVVDPQLQSLHELNWLSSWLVIYAFAFQIYFDFSGYTDIARGLARLFGFQLPENFQTPYLSCNITEFWRRWHMTLSRWLRDYLYISLGGNRHGALMTYRNLFLTMLLGGLWHGAGWNFVIWGALHGAYLAIHKKWMAYREQDPKTHKVEGWRRLPGLILTFHLVCIAWVFFRLPDFPKAWFMIQTMFGLQNFGLSVPELLWTSPVLQTVCVYGLFRAFLKSDEEQPSRLRWLVWGAFVLFFILYVPPGTRKFIYFEF